VAGEPHSVEAKLEAAVAYLITGNSEEAGEIVGIPGRTIRYWMKQSWWEDIIAEARTVKQKELDAIWTSLIHHSAKQLRERLQKGDEVVLKDGTIVSAAVKARDLALIMATAVDKRAVMRGEVTNRKETVSTEKKLQELEDVFKGLVTSGTDR
jgi:hypothetical protein